MNNFVYLFFTEFRKTYKSFLNRDRWRGMKQHFVVIQTYIYQTGASKFRLLVRAQHNGELYLMGDNTSITNKKVLILSPITTNFIGQFFRILTNNLNLKAPT